MYSALNTYCGITMPAFDLKLPSNQNYLNAVISILHTVDVVEGQQQAKIYAGAVWSRKAARLANWEKQQKHQYPIDLQIRHPHNCKQCIPTSFAS